MNWMTPRRLEWALRVYGTELAAWPAGERGAALSLMRRCGRARQVLADALAQEDAPLADAALLGKMHGCLIQRLAVLPPATPVIRWGALAACALAGLCLGIAGREAEPIDLFAAVQAIGIETAL